MNFKVYIPARFDSTRLPGKLLKNVGNWPLIRYAYERAARSSAEQVVIATDDMYEHILWNDEGFSNILMVAPELYDRTVVLNGISKVDKYNIYIIYYLIQLLLLPHT